VFLAQRPGEPEVALKLHTGQLTNPRAAKRFQREVQALQALSHPGIVRLRGAGFHGSQPYLVMDYVAGRTLSERLHLEGPLAPRTAARLVSALAEAVHHAHAQGVLHRDLKPANVILDAEGRPRLTDFGLSREVDPSSTRLTRTGGFVGTPGYWSPEQALGQRDATGPATDVYGLGAVLYACLTGRPPRGTQLDVSALSAPITPPREVAPAVPAWLERVCLRCLADDPAERFPSAAALARALDGPSPAPSAPRGSPWWIAAVGLGGVLLGALGVLALGASDPQETVETRPVDPAPAPTPPPTQPRAETEPPPVALAEAQQLVDAGNPRAALAALAPLLAAQPRDARLWALSGLAKSQLEAYADAQADLEHAADLDAGLSRVWLTLSHVRRKTGQHRGALDAVERSLALDPDQPNAHFNRGTILLGFERYDEAVASLDRCLALSPDDAGAYANRGMALQKAGRTAEALESHEACLRLEPDNVIALEGRGSLLLNLGRDAEALDDLTRVLRIDPQAPAGTWVNHGVALARLERFGEARRSLERAVALGLNTPTVLINLGRVSAADGDASAARAAYQRALRQIPPGPQHDEVQGLLDALR